MTTLEKIDAYFEKESLFREGINHIRSIVQETELQEDWKWNIPCYTVQGRNVIGIARFKNHFGLWFFQGVFLKDSKKVLRNAQDGKTKAMRSLHYESIEAIDSSILKAYILEAIQNAKDGKEVRPDRSKKEVVIPAELESAFAKAENLKIAFQALTPGKQREYTEHIGGAKQEATRLRRLEKCTPMILEGVGLNDKYKNC
ncbi:YdeI/OmpD-associated family protein [Dokdonia sp.]|uniref:YdeI/OmpD-associated family protein n=1 Tax=Dokdonia sp. TaxID=2024995 RepID=UPI003267D67E